MSQEQIDIALPDNRFKENTVDWALNRLFRKTSLVLIGATEHSGVWKTGKTNFALKIAERLLQLHLISEVASNIDTNGAFTKITDTETLKAWLDSDNRLKLFIFDEGNEHLPNYAFMSSKSTGFKSIIPQISKKHGRLIIVAQDVDTLDKTLRSKSWLRGTFKKASIKTATLTAYWNQHKSLYINNISATTISYDPYVSADWNEVSSKSAIIFNDADFQLVYRFASGEKKKDLGVHRQEFERLERKVLLAFFEKYKNDKSFLEVKAEA